jgi:hypothetical protein
MPLARQYSPRCLECPSLKYLLTVMSDAEENGKLYSKWVVVALSE